MKYSIKEISRLANVSPGTVSKALNGKKGVSEEKRLEIIRLAGEHNYIPNASARALSHQRTETVGLIVPTGINRSLLGVYWSEIITAIAAEVSRQNYNLLLIVPNSEKRLESLKQSILRHNMDGLIVPAEELSLPLIKLLKDSDIPFVIQGRSSLIEHYGVDVNNTSGSVALTKRLLQEGATNCACVAGPEDFLYTKERIAGFCSAMESIGKKNPPFMCTQYSESAAVSDIKDFFSRNKKIDGVFITAGGEFSFYVLRVLKELSFDMKKISFAVFDDFAPLHFLPFPVITGSQPIREMGTQSVQNLFRLINGEKPPQLSLFDIRVNG